MAQHSDIEWTDATWPIVQGCDYDSPGCTHCYAVRLLWRLAHNPNPTISQPLQGLVEKRGGKLVWTGKVALRRDRMDWPMKWTKPQKIFLPSHGDLFHDDVPDDFIDRVWAVMALTRHHTYQVLTKRSKRQQLYLSVDVAKRQAAILHEAKLIAPEVYEVSDLGGCHWWPLPNVWCGVSVEDRKRLPRLGHLRETPAAVRFISFEPLLEDLGDVDLTGIDQAICGGESGPDKRATDPAWHRRLLYQCRQQGVAFFEKQIDQVQPIPADLMVREFPGVQA